MSDTPRFYGMMNVRNEEKYIHDSIKSILPLCDFVFVVDDGSTDNTKKVCFDLGPRVVVFSRPPDMSDHVTDKTALKNYIYEHLLKYVTGKVVGDDSRDWVIAIDGDEVLRYATIDRVFDFASKTTAKSLSTKIHYLWDSRDKVRVDGCYGKMIRPSIFRIINPEFKFQPTPFPCNLHCPNVPQELLGSAEELPGVDIVHYGYIDRDTRIKKWLWRQTADPDNLAEGYYLHTIQGDIPSVPPEVELTHAGPLTLEPFK